MKMAMEGGLSIKEIVNGHHFVSKEKQDKREHFVVKLFVLKVY